MPSKAAGVSVELRDIARRPRARGVSGIFDAGTEAARCISRVGRTGQDAEANIKLPNISASAPQLVATIKELQKQGYKLPDYRKLPRTTRNGRLARYDKVKGSAVNPVLRKGTPIAGLRFP
jgi:isocitrate dehydrogenase